MAPPVHRQLTRVHKHAMHACTCLTVPVPCSCLLGSYTKSLMLSLTFLLLTLQLPCLVCQPHALNCFYLRNNGNSKDGDVLLTAFFPIYLYTNKMDTYHSGEQSMFTR